MKQKTWFRIRYLVYPACAAIIGGSSFAAYRLGQDAEEKQMRSIYADQEALGLVAVVQLAAMVRAGQTDHALKASEDYIDLDLIGISAFARPDQPPLDASVLSALKLTAAYRLKYRDVYSQTTPPSCCAPDIERVLSLGNEAGQFAYKAFADKYLQPAATASPPSP